MSKELYNTLEEALHSKNVFTLLSSCNDIALVVYDSDNLTYAELLSDFFYYNDLELGNIKEIIIHGKNKIAIRRKTLDISSYFIAPQITYTGLSGSEMYNYSQLKKMLCIHIIPHEIKREYISLVEKHRYMYQILISIKNDYTQIKVNTSLREVYSKIKSIQTRVSKYCKDKRTYLQRLIDSEYYSAAFYQCAQECKNGCDECPHANSYDQNKCCPYFQLQMAKFYENGWYVPKNDKIAHFWKAKAARQGLLEAKLNLANDYVFGYGCSQDIGEAISILMPLADQGSTLATHALIDIASSHHDYVSPLPLIARLANNGDLNMVEKMIEIYSKGDMFTSPDPSKCEEWVVLAAEHGCTTYVESLAQQYEAINDWDNATRWYLKLQELNPEMDLAAKIDELFTSKCQLLTSDELVLRGNKSYYGYECEQDYHTAYLYYKIATDKGNADGMFGLANCYFLGRGVELNEDEGNKLYELSANNNSADGIIRKLEELRKKSQDSDLELWKDRLRVVFINGEESNNPHILRLIGDEYRYNDNDIYGRDYDKAYYYYKSSMNLGDYQSIRMVGLCYCEGRGVKRDYNIARKFFTEAAEKGVPSAYHCLGCMFNAGNGVEKDSIESYKNYLIAAQKGHRSSQVEVARMLRDGLGVEQNETERAFWLEKAAIQGHEHSQCTLGEMYYWGETVNKDYKKSRYWTEKAALGGYTDAYFRYAYLCAEGQGGPIDYESALLYYSKLPNNAGALNNLGVMYASGEGVEADQEKANEYYKKAAERGSTMGMKNLADRYLSGASGEVDIAAAIEWYKKSFKAGRRESGIKLGDIYYEGSHVDEDIDAAIEYYESAVRIKPKKGGKQDIDEYVKVVVKLADIYYEGDKVEMDDSKANELYHIAAEYCNLYAYHRLGIQYYNGYGVEQDKDTAIYWFRKAASEGYSASIEFLDENNIDWISNDDYPDLPF